MGEGGYMYKNGFKIETKAVALLNRAERSNMQSAGIECAGRKTFG